MEAEKLQSGKLPPTSQEMLHKVWKTQGTRGLFTGLESQIMRDGPFYAFFFGSYEICVHLLKDRFPQMPEEAAFFVAGGLAGMIGWGLVMPADVPKSIIQASW